MFTLRQFELTQPYVEDALKGDVTAQIRIAALLRATDSQLAQISAGSEDILKAVMLDVYAADPLEVADKLHDFFVYRRTYQTRQLGLQDESTQQLVRDAISAAIKGRLDQTTPSPDA